MYKKYISLQRKLRKQMPAPEVILWQKLRNNQLGVKFRRQYGIENRILDFYAPSVKLGIEVDGETHFLSEHQREEELAKDKLFYKQYKITLIRVLNSDVMENLEGVITEIQQRLLST